MARIHSARWKPARPPAFSKMPFVLKRFKESAILHFRQDFHRDSAGNINSAQRQNFQRKIAGFRPIDGGPQDPASPHTQGKNVQAALGDEWSGIRIRIFENRMLHTRGDEIRAASESRARKESIPNSLADSGARMNFNNSICWSVRGAIIGMPALRSARLCNDCHPRTKFPRRGRCPPRAKPATAPGTAGPRSERKNLQAEGAQDCGQSRPGRSPARSDLTPNSSAKYFGIHNPGQIGRMDAVIDDRASHAESSGPDFVVAQVRRGPARKFPQGSDQIVRNSLLAKRSRKTNSNLPFFSANKCQIAFVPPTSPARITLPPDQFRH